MGRPEPLETPQGAESQDVTHLVQDHVREQSFGFESLQVGDIEQHRAEDGQISGVNGWAAEVADKAGTS